MDYSTIIIAVLSSELIVKIFEWIKGQFFEDSPINTAIKSLLKDRLAHLCKKYLLQGNIALDDFESLTDMFCSYSKLGGNGFIKELYEEVKKLPKV